MIDVKSNVYQNVVESSDSVTGILLNTLLEVAEAGDI